MDQRVGIANTLPVELVDKVVRSFSSPSQFSTACLLCRHWYRCCTNARDRAAKTLCDPLILLKRFIDDKDWDWKAISHSPRLNINFVLSHLDKSWDWDFLTSNPSIDFARLQALLQSGISQSALCLRPDLDLEGIQKHIPRWKLYKYMSAVSRNPNLTPQIIESNLDLSWDWYQLSKMRTITIDFILRHLDKTWNWDNLTENPAVSFKDIRRNPALPWTWQYTIHKPDITAHDFVVFHNKFPPFVWRFLHTLPHIDYDELLQYPTLPIIHRPSIQTVVSTSPEKVVWDIFSNNPSVSFTDIIANKHLPWVWTEVSANPTATLQSLLHHSVVDWKGFSRNPNITIQDVLQYENEDWAWDALSRNASIEPSQMLLHSELPWDWDAASENTSITIADVISNHDLPWDWTALSINPGISCDDIMQHADALGGWDWEIVSGKEDLKLVHVLFNLDKPWKVAGLKTQYENREFERLVLSYGYEDPVSGKV